MGGREPSSVQYENGTWMRHLGRRFYWWPDRLSSRQQLLWPALASIGAGDDCIRLLAAPAWFVPADDEAERRFAAAAMAAVNGT